MPFFNTAVLSICEETGLWMLVRPLRYSTRAGDEIVIPAGFRTDLASIPRAFHWLIPVNGRHRAAAILHDYLFVVQTLTRAETDALFLEAMTDSGVSWAQRSAMYAAVRAGGWPAWRCNTRQLAERHDDFLAGHGLSADIRPMPTDCGCVETAANLNR